MSKAFAIKRRKFAVGRFGTVESIFGVGGFGVNAVESAERAGEGIDNVLRRVDGEAYDIDIFLLIGDTHSADDVFAVLMQNFVEFGDRFGIFYNNAYYGDTRFHMRLLDCLCVIVAYALAFVKKRCFIFGN